MKPAVERTLSNRKRRAPKGRVLRVSNTVYAELNALRYGRSWDSLFRRMLGLPDRRTGTPQPLIEGMLDQHSGTFILRLDGTWPECEELAYRLADKWAKKLGVNRQPPLRMRELR